MSQRFPSVALAGATGALGPEILSSLLAAHPPFHSITILTRLSSPTPTTPPDPRVKVLPVDYTSVPSLQSALTGIDALISTLASTNGTPLAQIQKNLIDAALSTGTVKFFIPSEFGFDHTNLLLRETFTAWDDKIQTAGYLAGLEGSSGGGIDYALIFTGGFLDWGMMLPGGGPGLLLDLKGRGVELVDGGGTGVNLTSFESIGRVVVAVLEGKYAGGVDRDFKGKREIRVKDVMISQRRLFELAREVTGALDGDGGRGMGKEWTVTTVDTKKAFEEAEENKRRGRPVDEFAYLKYAGSMGVFGSVWSEEVDDSGAFGLKRWSEEDVKGLMRGLLGVNS